MKIDIERCSDGSAQNRTENGVGTVASGTVSGGWSPLHGASAGISDPSYQSLVGRDGWGGGERTALTTCTALAATVGTGNITGVAAALAIGGRVLCSGCGRRHFWGWCWHIRRFIWEFLYGADLMSIWKMGLEAVSLENAMPCFCVLASLGMGCMVQAGLWRIVCACSPAAAWNRYHTGSFDCRGALLAGQNASDGRLRCWYRYRRGCICWQVESPCSAFMIRYQEYWGTLWAGHLDWQIMQDRRMEAVF